MSSNRFFSLPLFPTYSIFEKDSAQRGGKSDWSIQLAKVWPNGTTKTFFCLSSSNRCTTMFFVWTHPLKRNRLMRLGKRAEFPNITSVGIEIRCKLMNKSDWERCTSHSNCFGSRKPMKFSRSKWRTCPWTGNWL